MKYIEMILKTNIKQVKQRKGADICLCRPYVISGNAYVISEAYVLPGCLCDF